MTSISPTAASSIPATTVAGVAAAEHARARADFSMVLGGPLYQLFRRAHLSGSGVELLSRRVLVLAGIGWLPLLLLALVSGHAVHGATIPFLFDVDVHVRFLVSLPLLIYAEVLVHQRFQPVIAQFGERNIVPPHEQDRFDEIIESSVRLRNSVIAEVILLALVFTLGQLSWRKAAALETATWYASRAADGTSHLTLPGMYFAFVSVPVFQFILMRWYYRLFIWCRFLFKVSRLDLRLIPTHPDRSAGLAFLQGSTFALTPLLVAQSALLAGVIANRIFYEGAKLPMFKYEIILFGLFLLLLALGPLMIFAPKLYQARRAGMREYGRLASRYVQEFDEKWVRGKVANGEALIGSADLQSLADLGNSFEVIREMQSFPFGRPAITRLAVMILLPLAPLVLTMIPLDELMNRLLKTLL